jgi:hypothetical protein
MTHPPLETAVWPPALKQSRRVYESQFDNVALAAVGDATEGYREWGRSPECVL